MRNDKVTTVLTTLKEKIMEYDKILTVPTGGTDSATAMAMMNNNPWMYLVMLALFGNGSFGNNNRGAYNGVLDMETQNKLNSLQSQINDNNNNSWAREAITSAGNRTDFAISQLAQSLGVGVGELRGAVSNVKDAIFTLGSQTGMGIAGVTNAINLGNLNLIQQLKDCCCEQKQLTITQGYEGQIRTLQQTQDILTGVRAENGLTRAEIAAFRQQWEQTKYNEALARAERLQTELDIVRNQQADAAAYGQFNAKLQQMEWQMQSFINTYGGSTKTAQQGS